MSFRDRSEPEWVMECDDDYCESGLISGPSIDHAMAQAVEQGWLIMWTADGGLFYCAKCAPKHTAWAK